MCFSSQWSQEERHQMLHGILSFTSANVSPPTSRDLRLFSLDEVTPHFSSKLGVITLGRHTCHKHAIVDLPMDAVPVPQAGPTSWLDFSVRP